MGLLVLQKERFEWVLLFLLTVNPVQRSQGRRRHPLPRRLGLPLGRPSLWAPPFLLFSPHLDSDLCSIV